jgi:hypothetical protein
MRWRILFALGLSACSTTTTVMHVADPWLVSLADRATGREVIPAGSAPLTAAELAPGLTVIRGAEGQLAASCSRCRVDDRDADGVWVFADGTTEALPVDASLLAADLKRGDLRIPVYASRSLGRRRSVGAELLLITPKSNVLEIRELTRADHLTREGVTFQEVAGAFVGALAAVSFGNATQTQSTDRNVLLLFGGLFSAAAVALFSTAILDPYREDRVRVLHLSPWASQRPSP